MFYPFQFDNVDKLSVESLDHKYISYKNYEEILSLCGTELMPPR